MGGTYKLWEGLKNTRPLIDKGKFDSPTTHKHQCGGNPKKKKKKHFVCVWEKNGRGFFCKGVGVKDYIIEHHLGQALSSSIL